MLCGLNSLIFSFGFKISLSLASSRLVPNEICACNSAFSIASVVFTVVIASLIKLMLIGLEVLCPVLLLFFFGGGGGGGGL